MKALWHDTDTGETKAATAGDPAGSVKTLREVCPTEHRAAAAASAAADKTKRDRRELNLTLALGGPEIVAGQPLELVGFRPEIDDVDWTVEELTHTLDDKGLITKIKAKGDRQIPHPPRDGPSVRAPHVPTTVDMCLDRAKAGSLTLDLLPTGFGARALVPAAAFGQL